MNRTLVAVAAVLSASAVTTTSSTEGRSATNLRRSGLALGRRFSPDGTFVVTSIDTPTTEFYHLFDISAQFADRKQFDVAELAWNKALVLAPGDPRGHQQPGQRNRRGGEGR